MKSLCVILAGLAAGLWLSTTLGGCVPDACPDPGEIPTGIYVPETASAAESDYTLAISTPTGTALETFTRNGRRYRLRYALPGGPVGRDGGADL